ncbi:hypothetical protein DSM3645_00055 [Blastopirellula marina DSM 3645]|uniref:Carboxypeptidase regulatory-like domain-containing protein n=2 Tax=Blastopirellula marina TaxID=124 RepID=A3ZM90_9BACT|nr:hypothetical protein DSM3645_00055 [Blastopirellula marina DSM 3645]
MGSEPARQAEPQKAPPMKACPLFALLVAALSLGCGGSHGPQLFPVQGKVTYEGKPLSRGTIIFNPVNEALPASRGEIQPDGTYVLSLAQAGDGAVPGEHRVIVNSSTQVKQGMEINDPDYELPRPLVPTKYSSLSTTPLSQTVKEEPNTIDIEL